MQSAAEPSLCRVTGQGICCALIAGQPAALTIHVRARAWRRAEPQHQTCRAQRCGHLDSCVVLSCDVCPPSLVPPTQARDEADNPRLSGGDAFRLLVLPGRPSDAACSGNAPSTIKAIAEGQIIDAGDGSYACTLTLTTAGPHELHVTNGATRASAHCRLWHYCARQPAAQYRRSQSMQGSRH